MAKVHVKQGDKVCILSGKDKGKTGKILNVMPRSGKVIVEGINLVKKHQRPTRDNPQGGIMEKEGPIYSAKVMLVCPRCNKPARVGYQFLADGQKVRYCKNCGEVNDK
jgi:large subunit ribosomal protein L24